MRTYRSHIDSPSSHTSRRSTVAQVPLNQKIRVALYVRVSTDKQAEYGLSLDAQKAELERYCRERKFDISELYVDGDTAGRGHGAACLPAHDRGASGGQGSWDRSDEAGSP